METEKPQGLLFVCKLCWAERFGGEEVKCEHRYRDYIVKDGSVYKKLFGDIPRIELFAREKTEGWDVFGNEVEDSINLTNYGEPK